MKTLFRRWFWIAGSLLAMPAHAQPPDTNASCFRCHSMATMARRAPTGEVQSLAVIPAQYAQSEHGRLDCVACHTSGYTKFPHAPKVASPAKAATDIARQFDKGSNYQKHPELFSCFDCHNRPPTIARPRISARQNSRVSLIAPLPREDFARIAEEFLRSVHYRKHPDLFSCFSCHDPHSSRRWAEVTRQSISEQNDVCLKCHASQGNYSRIAKRHVPDMAVVHGWLPHREVHMRQVRCLDCHSSYQPPAKSHNILPKAEAVRDCVKCHSANSVLRQKLYLHQRRQEAARLGFANALIVNDAYVIGATRNRALDSAGVLIVGLTVFGVAIHLTLRRFGSRASRGDSHE